jgi:3-oxoacyl-[acyl-carrier protein] reductase
MHTAIVTGGSRGIGFAIAQAILDDGGRVMITGRDAARVDAAVAALVDRVGEAARVAGSAVDVRNRGAVERLVADVANRFGGFNTLINNAGVGAFSEVAVMTDDDWDHVIQTNLTGVFYCCRAAIPRLKMSGGWIINIASLAGRNYFAGGAAYCASKAGLIAFTEALMQEVRFDNIRVSVVMPGSVETDFGGPTHGKTDTSSWKLTPDDVAEAVMSLLRHPARSLPSRIEIRPAKTK